MAHPPALVSALADRDARAARRGRLAAVARAWSALPPLAELRAALDAIDPDGLGAAECVLAHARGLLAEIGWIGDGVRLLARALAADPLFEPPLRGVRDETQHGLVLVDHPLLRVTASVLPADAIARRKTAMLGRRAVGFTGRRTLYRFERAAGAELDLWRAPPAAAHFTAAGAGRCDRVRRLSLADGTLLELDGACEAWTFARVPRDILLVQAVVQVGAAPLATEYDAAGGAFLAARAGTTAVSRMEMMAALLGRMQRRDAVPVLAMLARTAPFALRWRAAREMVALDAGAALPILRGMAGDDPHEEVRAAAQATLAMLAA